MIIGYKHSIHVNWLGERGMWGGRGNKISQKSQNEINMNTVRRGTGSIKKYPLFNNCTKVSNFNR